MSIGDATTANRYYAARAAEYDDIYRKREPQVDLRHIEEWLPPLLSKKIGA